MGEIYMKDEWEEGSNEWDEDEMEDKEDLGIKTNTNDEALVLKHTDDYVIIEDS